MNWLSPDPCWHVTAPVTSGAALRSRQLLDRIIDQFDVETHARYQRNAKGDTMCNTFVNDVTRALAAEVAQRELKMVEGAPRIVELDANAMIDWLAGYHGQRNGWVSCDEHSARAAADAGYPVVVAWSNPGGIGHVAVGTPAPVGMPDDGHLWIAAAGAHNFRRCLVAQSFGAAQVRYFTHA